MQTVERIDAFMLAQCTRVAHWLQRTTGRTTYSIAKCFLSLAMLSDIIRALNYWGHFLVMGYSLLSVITIIPMTGVFLLYSYLCDKSDADLLSSQLASVKKPFFLALGEPKFRIIQLAVSISENLVILHILTLSRMPILDIIAESWVTYMMLFCYFASVDPLPPGISKLHEWLESLKIKKPVEAGIES
ncbi:MAG: hypothetical protein AAB372_03805 [Patescibacteria group bacterium]